MGSCLIRQKKLSNKRINKVVRLLADKQSFSGNPLHISQYLLDSSFGRIKPQGTPWIHKGHNCFFTKLSKLQIFLERGFYETWQKELLNKQINESTNKQSFLPWTSEAKQSHDLGSRWGWILLLRILFFPNNFNYKNKFKKSINFSLTSIITHLSIKTGISTEESKNSHAFTPFSDISLNIAKFSLCAKC